MRVHPVVMLIAAVILALPFGWGLGVVLAYAIAGPQFGVLPALTIPIATAGAIAFVLASSMTAQTRLAIMAGGSAVFVVLSLIGWPV